MKSHRDRAQIQLNWAKKQAQLIKQNPFYRPNNGLVLALEKEWRLLLPLDCFTMCVRDLFQSLNVNQNACTNFDADRMAITGFRTAPFHLQILEPNRPIRIQVPQYSYKSRSSHRKVYGCYKAMSKIRARADLSIKQLDPTLNKALSKILRPKKLIISKHYIFFLYACNVQFQFCLVYSE